MAGDTHYEKGKMDISEHKKTFELFWWLTKWGLIVNLVVLAFLAVFFTN